MNRTLVLLLIICTPAVLSAQQQYPQPFPHTIDSFLNIAGDKKKAGETRSDAIKKIDTILHRFEKEFPLFTGIVRMYQAYHSPSLSESINFRAEGIRLMAENKKNLPDSFAAQCFHLLSMYSQGKRENEWQAADSILKTAIAEGKSSEDWIVLQYAQSKFNQGHYNIARYLSSYALVYAAKQSDEDPDMKLLKIFGEWMVLKSRVELWKAMPYYERPVDISFNKDFKNLIDKLSAFRTDAVTNNRYGSEGFRDYLRTSYYNTYKNLLITYAEWVINDHREGQAILALKRFIFEDLIPDEMNEALKDKRAPIINCADLKTLVGYLSILYINTGNGRDAYYVAKRGDDFILSYEKFSKEERLAATAYLWYLQTIANRVEGKFEASLLRNKLLKKWWPLPLDNSAAGKEYWMWHIEANLQEIYTMIAQKRNKEAGDSLAKLTGDLEPIENDTLGMLSESVQWPQLQYVSMQYMAARGRWDVVKDYMLEVLTILEQRNHWENVPYYFQAQLLYLVATYRIDGKLLKHILPNLLFYTGRQLQYTFIMITPEERMRLYEQKLSPFFELYHELLFNKILENDPALREQIIAQSLYLKNSLVDGNVLPEDFLAKSEAIRDAVESTRRFRNETNLLANRLKIRRAEEKDSRARDANQSLWLSTLELADLDTRAPFTQWKKIADQLTGEQVYVEVVRYTNWLTDSVVMYGAYLVRDGKLTTVRLCAEDTLMRLLDDPSSSPQTGTLASNNPNRSVITKKTRSRKTFQQGDTDRLGKLLLEPLWQYISDKKELMIVPDGVLNRISLSALQWHKKYLFSYTLVKQLSGSYVLGMENPFPEKGKALVAGGLDYGSVPDSSNINRVFKKDISWTYLPGTLAEVHKLKPIFNLSGQDLTLLTGKEFPDSLRVRLEKYDFIHFATHGFYVDSADAEKIYNFSVWDPESIRGEPLFRCGIAVSGANDPDEKDVTESEGHLLGFELAATDLRKCYLISLSACETGLGDLRNNLGVDGLSRALKLGGARHLLISLWKVPDQPTAVFMERFYKDLFHLKSPSLALQATQQFMSKNYPPSDWAAFVLVE